MFKVLFFKVVKLTFCIIFLVQQNLDYVHFLPFTYELYVIFMQI